MFSDTFQGCALRRRRLREGKDGEAAHINHMKLLPDIRARLPSWTGLSDQQCGAVRCDCDLMAVERWDQLTKRGMLRVLASLEECDAGQWIIFWVGRWVRRTGQVREEYGREYLGRKSVTSNGRRKVG